MLFSRAFQPYYLYACYTRGTERELYVFLTHCQQKCYPESLGHVVWKTKLRIAQMQLINVSPIANSTKNGMARRYPLMPPCLSINYLAIMATSRNPNDFRGVRRQADNVPCRVKRAPNVPSTNNHYAKVKKERGNMNCCR